MPESSAIKVGDRVRHVKRPEWGVGHVQRSESVQMSGTESQRLLVRFANAGLKTLSTLGAQLEVVEGVAANGSTAETSDTLLGRESAGEAGWLAQISKSKPEDAMVVLPDEACDPFRPLATRLRATLDLYRFHFEGASLVDWAVARSGLADPLSRFTRHELEDFFKKWSVLRDRHLAKLVEECRHEPSVLASCLKAAPPRAVAAVKRLNAPR